MINTLISESEHKMLTPIETTIALLNIHDIYPTKYGSTTTYNKDDVVFVYVDDKPYLGKALYISQKSSNTNHPVTDKDWWKPMSISSAGGSGGGGITLVDTYAQAQASESQMVGIRFMDKVKQMTMYLP